MTLTPRGSKSRVIFTNGYFASSLQISHEWCTSFVGRNPRRVLNPPRVMYAGLVTITPCMFCQSGYLLQELLICLFSRIPAVFEIHLLENKYLTGNQLTLKSPGGIGAVGTC